MKNSLFVLFGILFLIACLFAEGCGSSGSSGSGTANTPEEQEAIDIATGYFHKFCESKEKVLNFTSESFTYMYGSTTPVLGNYSAYSARLDNCYDSYAITSCELSDAAAISVESQNAMVGGKLSYEYCVIGSGEIASKSEEIEIGLTKDSSSAWIINLIRGRNSRGVDFPPDPNL